MNRIVVAAAVVSLMLPCMPSLAQSPPSSPAAETTNAFTAAEAYAFACCQRLAAGWRHGEPVFMRGWVAPGYCGIATARVEGTQLRFDDKVVLSEIRMQFGPGNPVTVTGGDVLWYFVPEQAGDEARRVFCVRGDGVVAFSDNTAGTAMNGGRAPEPKDALGDGGNDELGSFPRTPGRGNDGNMWMPGDLVKQATARVMVVDENGVPHAALTIAAVPAESAQDALEIVFPAGVGRTLREGDATWTGVPAQGLSIEVRAQDAKLSVAKSAVTATGSSLRVVVKRGDVKRLGLGRNELAAIATMKNISSAQAQCQAAGVIDANQNGAGEYGTFAELTGRDVVRGGKEKISPPVLSTAFSKVEDGVTVRSGYCFRLFLPGKDGAPLAELARGGPDAAVDAAQAETLWCLYAWPIEPGVSGQRAFFVDQSGDVLAAPNDDGRYAGKAKAPAASAARAAGTAGKLHDACAPNGNGLDGQRWIVVN